MRLHPGLPVCHLPRGAGPPGVDTPVTAVQGDLLDKTSLLCRTSGGYTPDGTFIIVVYELIDPDTIYPVTAYEVPEP